MVDKKRTKTFMRSHGQDLRGKMSRFYASTFEPRIARLLADDVDITRGAATVNCHRLRPGQRDDAFSCGHSTLLPV